ncbi:MAG: HipA domain-containing protein [Arachnia sp.]
MAQVSFRELISAGSVDPSSIPGIQDKLSSGMITVPVSTPSGQSIIKLNPPEYPFAVQNESLFLTMARGLGVTVSPHRIIHDRDGEPALVVERFDRVLRDDQPVALAVEDGCQLLNIYPADKYNVSAEEVVEALSSVCAARPVAVRNAYLQLLFAWLTGDGDVHAKNLSAVQSLQGEWRMSPIYDVPSTLPYGDTTMALTMGGRAEGLIRKHLLDFGRSLGLSSPAATSGLERVLKTTASLIPDLESRLLPFDEQRTRRWVRQLTRRRRDAIHS